MGGMKEQGMKPRRGGMKEDGRHERMGHERGMGEGCFTCLNLALMCSNSGIKSLVVSLQSCSSSLDRASSFTITLLPLFSFLQQASQVCTNPW